MAVPAHRKEAQEGGGCYPSSHVLSKHFRDFITERKKARRGTGVGEQVAVSAIINTTFSGQ